MKRILLGISVFAVILAAVGMGATATHAQAVSVIVSQSPIGSTTTTASTTGTVYIKASSTYYVRSCGLHKNAAVVVDTTGGGLWSRATYMSDSSGCVNYSAVAYAITGPCALTIQQFAGSNLQVAAVYQFQID